MKLIVFSASPSFEKFLKSHLDLKFDFVSKLQSAKLDTDFVYLLHISSLKDHGYEWLEQNAKNRSITLGVCADVPLINEMLECVQMGAKSYCNSHMAASNYAQMLQAIGKGSSWFPPQMLTDAFKLAQKSVKKESLTNSIDMLTPREKQVALAVGEGKSNGEIAVDFEIKERTVKSHLSKVFKKLEIKDRVALALYLN